MMLVFVFFSGTYLLNLNLELSCKNTDIGNSDAQFARGTWDCGDSLTSVASENCLFTLPLQTLAVLLVTEKSIYNLIFPDP